MLADRKVVIEFLAEIGTSDDVEKRAVESNKIVVCIVILDL